MTLRSPPRAASRPASWGAALFAAVLLGGCALNPEAPTIHGVSPTWGYNGEPTRVEIAGDHFFPTVIVGDVLGTEADEGRIEGTFEAWLVGDHTFPLDAVQHVAYDRIGAEVPEGLPTGVYDLQVRVPAGLITIAPAAFTVTDTRADHLEITVDDAVVFDVRQNAALTVRLQDPEGHTVAQPLVVEIVARPDDHDTKVVFDEDGLIDQESFNGGLGVRGRLSSTGVGKVNVHSETEDEIDFDVNVVKPTVVRGDRLRLSWKKGAVHSVEVELPSADFVAVAGVPFDVTVRFRDENNNLVPSEGTVVFLGDERHCQSWYDENAVVGRDGIVSLELTEACPDNRITVSAFGNFRVQSDAFAVVPAEQDGYKVEPTPVFSVVTAGVEFPVFVTAVDAFDNVLTDHTASLTLYDDLGGLDPARDQGTQLCTGFTEGVSYCRISTWTAGQVVVLRAVDEEGETGFAPIEVVASNPEALLVSIDTATVAAGENFAIRVRAVDTYGNSVEFDPSADRITWFDDSNTIGCTWSASVTGAEVFDCAIYAAVDTAYIEAHVLGLVGVPDTVLRVTNGVLAEVEVDPEGVTFVAGAAFTLQLRGFDAYGNPYTVHTDAEIDLIADTGASVVPGSWTLGPTGVVEGSASIYRAGSALRIEARQAGVLLGTSPAILVSPDVLDSFDVVAPAWISVDRPGDVVITAVDAYRNPIPDYTGTVVLSSRGTACDTEQVDSFANGIAKVPITCGTPQLTESLSAVDMAGYEGTSDVVDVVDLECADGPTARLLLDGDEDSIRCLAAGRSVRVAADSSGSSGSIAVRHFSDAETTERTWAASRSFTYDTRGTRYIEVLVADADACADIAGGYSYVGLDGGEPTGPVEVTSAASTVRIGESTVVTLTARDCTQDLAVGRELLVRADLGTVNGTPTGEGLVVTLGAAGSTTLTWTLDSRFGGAATFYAGSAGGAAIGSTTVTSTGDDVRPTVVEVSPSGRRLGTISTVEVTFSEPMNPSLLTRDYLSISGPLGTVPSVLSYSADLMTVVLTPNTPIDGSAGVYTLTVSEHVRDLVGGHRLDGLWSGSASAASFTFGNVGGVAPAAPSCAESVATFTPDGDDGAGAEADGVTITLPSTGTPSWWWLTVHDADNTRVRSLRKQGSETILRWDGRGDDGIIRETGQYVVNVAAVDSFGNIGAQCEVAIELQQHVDPP